MNPIDPHAAPATAEDLKRLARKRAGMRMGWLIHTVVFVAVNVVLTAISASGGRQWAIYPLLGWGLGLAIHGAVVFLATGGFGLQERLVQHERERLGAGRVPHDMRGSR